MKQKFYNTHKNCIVFLQIYKTDLSFNINKIEDIEYLRFAGKYNWI